MQDLPGSLIHNKRSPERGSRQFQYLAARDLYAPARTTDQIANDGRRETMTTLSIEDYEKSIDESKRKNYSKLLSGIPNSCIFTCEVTGETGRGSKLKFECQPVQKSCSFYRKFGSMRFLTVTINLKSGVEINDIFPRGEIEFAGLTYKFLGGEIGDGRSIDMPESKQIVAWFFVERDFPGEESFSVTDLREWLGNFSRQPTLKVNCRLSLGFSPSTMSNFTLSDANITVIDDIKNEGGQLMTDGCGYIAVSSSWIFIFLP